MQIYQTENFIVVTPDQPHVSRSDGGHIVIYPKILVVDRIKLSPRLTIELARLTMLVGEAMTIGLNIRGVDVGRINYQDNGNWSVFKPEGPHLHIHLYGRAKSAAVQKWGDALYFPYLETGFYDACEGLNEEDVAEIQKQIELLEKEKRYTNEEWGLEV